VRQRRVGGRLQGECRNNLRQTSEWYLDDDVKDLVGKGLGGYGDLRMEESGC
jgi:hypothetical protein